MYGEMDFVMNKGRDHWNCNCEKYASMNPWKVDDPDRPEIPIHPNCMCEWVPRLKTDEEIIAAFRDEMKEELEAIEGSDEQKAMLDAIDKAEAESMKGTEKIIGLVDGGSNDFDLIREGDIQPASLRKNEPAIAKALLAENDMQGYSNEAAYIIDKDGNVLEKNLLGNRSDVSISRSLIKGNTITHNHVSGGTLSDLDVSRFALYEAREFRACNSAGLTYSIRAGESVGDKTIAGDYTRALTEIKKEATSYSRRNGNTEDEINMLYSNMVKEKANTWLVDNASKYNYIYTIENRGE